MRNKNIAKFIKKRFSILIIFLFMFLYVYSVNSNNTLSKDLIKYKGNESYPGYTLIIPICNQDHALLIDMDHKVIHNWSSPFIPAKILPNGVIIGTSEYNDKAEKKFIIQKDWEGNIIWQFNNWEDGWARQHHDLEREGNPVGYYAPGQDFIEKGKTLVLAHSTVSNISISKWPLYDDVIYEVDWDGNLTGFEWYANEHYKEMGFNIWAKLGIFYQKLQFLDPSNFRGWLHINSLSELGENQWYDKGDNRFNPHNIIIDSRHANFIIIIERSTGNIVWRVGPEYSKNTDAGLKLGQIIGPHNAHMIPKDLPGEGNILVFDNGGSAGYGILGLPCRYTRFYSRVIEFNPITYEIVWEYKDKEGLPFLTNVKDHRFFSELYSSVQRLPNGNTLICEGSRGRIFEVTPEKNNVWEYIYPGVPGCCINNAVYRAYRVPPEWIPGNPSGYDAWE